MWYWSFGFCPAPHTEQSARWHFWVKNILWPNSIGVCTFPRLIRSVRLKMKYPLRIWELARPRAHDGPIDHAVSKFAIVLNRSQYNQVASTAVFPRLPGSLECPLRALVRTLSAIPIRS
jgi:hypothetical protein